MIELVWRGWMWVRWGLDRTMRLFKALIDCIIGAWTLAVLLMGGFDLMVGRDGQEDGRWSTSIVGAGVFALGSWICIACLRAALLWLSRQFRTGRAVS